MKTILDKLKRGEALTEEERAKFSAFNLDDAINTAAASARRKAEADADAARKQAEALKARVAELEEADRRKDEGKLTETQKHAQAIEALNAKIARLEKEKAEADTKAAALAREQAIESIRAKAGVQFVAGIDPALATGAFRAMFDGLDDLSDDKEVSSRVARFRDINKALVLDTSGGGSGLNGSPGGGAAGNPWARDHFNLTRQIDIERTDPTRAAALKAQAGA